MTPIPPAAARCEACETHEANLKAKIAEPGAFQEMDDVFDWKLEDWDKTHHALLAQRTRERDDFQAQYMNQLASNATLEKERDEAREALRDVTALLEGK